MKLVVTFFLSLCFLLLRGGGHLYAHTNHHPANYSPAHLPERTKTNVIGDQRNTMSVTGKTATSNTADNTADAREVEDDEESSSSRKYVEFSNYFTEFFYANAPPDIQLHHKNRLPVCEHFSYISSFKYILQRVIRI